MTITPKITYQNIISLIRLKKEEKKLSKNQIGLLCPYGIGDTYLVLSLLTSISKKNNASFVLFIKKNQSDIRHIFKYHANIKFVEIENLDMRFLFLFFNQLKKNKIFFAHPYVYFRGKGASFLGYGNISLLDSYKIIFGLNEKTKIEKPSDIKSKIIIRKKSVLLCPEANTIKKISKNFWTNLAKDIEDKGYKVYFLENKNPKKYFNHISFSLAESINVANKFEYVICLRSGFCDLISSSNTNLIIIYPNIKYFYDKFIDFTSLIKMGLNNHAVEIIYSENCKAEVLKKIK